MRPLCTVILFIFCLAIAGVPSIGFAALTEQEVAERDALNAQLKDEQERLKIELERIKLEMQEIMRQIAASMKEEQEKLKLELEALKAETSQLREQILAILTETRLTFKTEKEALQKELETYKKETELIAQEISGVLESQQKDWARETQLMQDSLVDAQNTAQEVNQSTGKVLFDVRKTSQHEQEEQQSTMTELNQELRASLVASKARAKSDTNKFRQQRTRTNRETLAAMKSVSRELGRSTSQAKKNLRDSRAEIMASLQQDKPQVVDPGQEEQNRAKQKEVLASLKQNVRKTPRKPKPERTRPSSRKSSPTPEPAREKAPSASRPDKEEAPLGGQRPKRIAPATQALSVEERLKQEEARQAEDLQEALRLAELNQRPVDDDELLAHEKKLTEFSNRIKNLKDSLRSNPEETAALLADLGKAYMESHDYLDSMNGPMRLALVEKSSEQDLILGSVEMSIWALKLALEKRNEGDISLLISNAFDSLADGTNALRYMNRARREFREQRLFQKATQTETQIKSLQTKYRIN